MLAAVIRPDETIDIGELPEAQIAEVIGGWLEGLAVPALGAYAFVDEEGKLKGLPANRLATALLRPSLNDVICGTMVLTGPADTHGNATDLPEAAALRIFSLTIS